MREHSASWIPREADCEIKFGCRMFTEECPWNQQLKKGGEGIKNGEREKLGCNMEPITDSASPWRAQKPEWVFRVVLSQTEMLLQR